MVSDKIRRFALLVALVLGVIAVPAVPVGAVNVFKDTACTSATKDSQLCKGTKNDTIKPIIATITGILLFAVGAVSVIMIIIGGIRYTTSNGDSSQISAAKNTILYAVVGLIVALLAYTIVNFVVTYFDKET